MPRAARFFALTRSSSLPLLFSCACGTQAVPTGSSESTGTGGATGTAGTGGESPAGGAAAGGSAAGSASGGQPATAGAGGGQPSSGGQGSSSGGSGSSGGGGSAAEGGSGGQSALGPLQLSNPSVELNPKMPLGATVRWTTDQAANSEVRFGTASETHHILIEESTTEHEVYVVGMRAETLYMLSAHSTNSSATGSTALSVTTGSLPTALPAQADVVTPASATSQPGYTLLNFWDSGQSPTLALILDPEGYPVWYYENGPGNDQFGATSTQWTADGTILIGNAGNIPAREVDLAGNVLWEGPTGGGAPLSHETYKLPGGTYFVVRESASTAVVEELDSTGQMVWSFDLYQDSPITNNGVSDWCHVNTAYTDPTEEHLFFNCRFQGFFKIQRSTKSILWQLGAGMDDAQTGDVTYLPDNSVRFNDAHDPEMHDDGTVLVYDNQGWSNRAVGDKNGSYHSRVVEYALDENTREATLTWEFPGQFQTDPWYSTNWSTPIWGDADRLENTNVLVTAGLTGTTAGGMTPAGTRTRIFEVTRAGEVVWAIEWPEGKGSYRAERISLPAQPIP